MLKLNRSSLLALALAVTACAQSRPGAPVPLQSAADSTALTELLRLEDTRSFDAVAFQRLAAVQPVYLRARVMLAAGRIGDKAASPLLIAGLSDNADSVRANAAFALGELADTSGSVIAALGTISRSRGVAAAEALHALGKLAAPGARVYVEEALRTRKDGPEAREALLAIWHFPRQAATGQLIRQFMTSSDPELRWRAVYALTRPGPDPANVGGFIAWLSDSAPLVRSFAARGLRAATADSAHQRAQAAAALISALKDVDAHVRINAVSVLAGYRDSSFAAPAIPLLNDPDLNVRIAAAQALGFLKGATAAAALDARVRDASERTPIRGAALSSLLLADSARGIAAARELASSQDWLLRLYVARALAASRTAAGLDLMRSLAGDPNPRVAAAAVSSLGTAAGDTLQALRALFIEKLAAADVYVRAEALGALERIAQPGDEAIVFDAFEYALQDSTEDAAVAAIGVLAKLSAANPAILRTFAARFPISRMRLPEVQRTAIRQMKLEAECCQLVAQPALYDAAVREVLLPALRGHLPHARIATAGGTIEIELLAADAPLTVLNFMRLAEKGYYRDTRWHRVVPNFVLQDGDPTGTGNGGPGYAIRDEINRVRYLRGAVGMALSGPDTGGSQYFITHSPQPHLDGGYTVFGRVVSGMETADRVIQDDPITSIQILR